MNDDALTQILAAVRRLEAGQDDLRAAVTTLRIDVMARLDRHENHLSTIRDDIAVFMGRADQAALVAGNTRDEMRALGQQIGIQQRQISKLIARLDALEPKT
jgi:predicted  nucleic acid-binding Zn-ribbon protein